LRFVVMVVVALAMAGSVAPAQAEKCVDYEPTIVTLHGKVRMVSSYGPPGFGEDPVHDRREEFAVLDLDTQTCLTAGRLDEVARFGVVSFQLVPSPGARFTRRFLGTRVAVTGSLWTRESGEGVTNVLFVYSKVRPSP